jgi:hypothetical protein
MIKGPVGWIAKSAAAFPLWICLGISGCNLFREVGDLEPESADAFVLEGHLKLQKSDYEGALAQYDAALKRDSSKSEAYYGAAKASLLQRRINMFALMQTFQENDPGKVPFLGEPDSVKDRIYTANRAINFYLRPMIRRDTLDLLDGKVKSAAISADYALATAIEAVLSLADFNGDGRIDSRDNILAGIIDLTDPSKLNPDSLMRNLADIKNDTAKITALNSLLEKSQSLLTESGSAIDLFLNTALDKGDSAAGGLNCAPADSACLKAKAGLQGADRDKVGDSAVSQVKQFLQNAGASVVIYKVFDREDNDGDGCVDEELLDGIDNDGDGIIDEDSRGAPDTAGNTRYRAEKDGADNDLNGDIDNTEESQFQARYETSFAVLALLAHPDRKGRIHYRDGTDTRILNRIVIDSTSTPALVDSVYTFDLCQGDVTGYKYRKANP